MDATSSPDPALRDEWIDVPHPSRLAVGNARRAEIIARHRTAVDADLPTYVDPASGFSVFTATFLAKRGYCCESGCRHCPFMI